MLIYDSLIRDGVLQSSFGNPLLQLYTDFGAHEDALALFSTMDLRDAIAWTLIIKAHLHNKDLALASFQQMQQEGVLLQKFPCIGILSVCADKASFQDGMRIHAAIFAAGLEEDVFVATAILSMYSNCCRVSNARATFERMSNRDAVAWNAMLSAYVNAGKPEDVLTLFEHMQEAGVSPTRATFLSTLEACATLASHEATTRILGHIFTQQLQGDVSIGNAIIHMYSKCSSIENARAFFDQMVERDIISWNTMIATYTQDGQEKEALALFHQMQEEKLSMDNVTFVSVLSSCVTQTTLPLGERIHNHIMCIGTDMDVVVNTALVNMYAKSGRLDEAQCVFESMPKRDIISWNTMISAYGQHGFCDAALEVFDSMQSNKMKPDKITYFSIFDACACVENLNGGRKVHDLIEGSEMERDVLVGTALVRMYGNCDCLEEAELSFDRVSEKDIILWNSMLTLYVEHEKTSQALVSYNQMLEEGVLPDKVTLSSLLNAFGSQNALELGKRMHASCVGNIFEVDMVVLTSITYMYGKCGCVEAAHLVFDEMQVRDLVAWTTMISLYSQLEKHSKALQLFWQLQQEGLIPDVVTLVGAISACASEGALFICKQLHACFMLTEFFSDIVLGNALISTYSKCCSYERALLSFEHMDKRDNVSFLNILSACASQAASREGQKVHTLLIVIGMESETTLSHALVNMYGKCGMLRDARKLFDQMTECNVVSWNGMIAAYSQSGDGVEALSLFEEMQGGESKPDNSTIVSTLTACSHAGLINEGYWIVHEISGNPGVSIILDHYNCMLDILARAGQLDEAEGLIKLMPLRPTILTWTTLLGACKTEADVERGERIAAHAMCFDPDNLAIHLSLSNIFSVAGRKALVDME